MARLIVLFMMYFGVAMPLIIPISNLKVNDFLVIRFINLAEVGFHFTAANETIFHVRFEVAFPYYDQFRRYVVLNSWLKNATWWAKEKKSLLKTPQEIIFYVTDTGKGWKICFNNSSFDLEDRNQRAEQVTGLSIPDGVSLVAKCCGNCGCSK